MHPLFGLGGWSLRVLRCTGLEAILELSGNALHVSHTSSTGSLSPLSLLAPVVYNISLASGPRSRAIDVSEEFRSRKTYIAES